MHKYCILSIQLCDMLLYTQCFEFFILGFAIYPGFRNLPSSLRGRFYFTEPTHSQMDFKLQTTTRGGQTIFQCTQAH